MQSRKLNEHVEEELFNKDKRKKNQDDFLSEESKSKIIKTITENGEYVTPAKKKKPYYRKRYKKPSEVEVIPEPIKQHRFILGVLTGLILSAVIQTIINLLN